MPESLPEELIAARKDAEEFIENVLVPLEEEPGDQDKVSPQRQETVREASKKAGFFLQDPTFRIWRQSSRIVGTHDVKGNLVRL